jgi:hypothetical protein
MQHARFLIAIATTFALVAGSPAAAQTASLSSEAEVRAAVQRIFDGMKEADSAKVRSVFAEGARFASAGVVEGAPTIRYQPVDGWIRAIGASGGTWEERLYDVEVRIDGNMAMVWAPYTFLRAGEISHCGINSIAMLRSGERWLVTQLSDTRHQGTCRER